MFALLRLLFSANYWRAVFHPETWRRSNISLRRAHKDKRARKHLFNVVLLLLIPLLCMLYVAWIIGSGFGLVGALAVLLIGGTVSGWRNRKSKREDAPVSLDLKKTEEPEDIPPRRTAEDWAALRREFAELALLHAVLADRAVSEQFVQTKTLPEGSEVVTRRKHIETLRVYGLYDRMEPTERELLLLPDGHWKNRAIQEGTTVLEPLRVLRWVLRIDSFLPVVGSTMASDFGLKEMPVKQPQTLFRGSKLIEMVHLKSALDAAEHYFYRCWAEGVRRNLFHPAEDEQVDGLRGYAEGLDGNEAEDLLLGSVIVSRATEEDVRWATSLSYRRAEVLRWVQQRMSGELEAMKLLHAFGISRFVENDTEVG